MLSVAALFFLPSTRAHTHTHTLIGGWQTAQHVISVDLQASDRMCDMSFKCVPVSASLRICIYQPLNAQVHMQTHRCPPRVADSVKRDPRLAASWRATGKQVCPLASVKRERSDHLSGLDCENCAVQFCCWCFCGISVCLLFRGLPWYFWLFTSVMDSSEEQMFDLPVSPHFLVISLHFESKWIQFMSTDGLPA